MNESFNEYLKKMGLVSESCLKKLNDILEFASRLVPEPIEDVFISQSNEENKKITEWDSLWFFSKKYCLEARQFLVHNDFELYHLEGLRNVRLILENCELSKLSTQPSADPPATLVVEFNPSRGGRCQLYAYGQNCEKLSSLVFKFLQTNITSGIV